jgi:hypothetical protein
MAVRRRAGCNGCGSCSCCIKDEAGGNLPGTGDAESCYVIDRYKLLTIEGNIVSGPTPGTFGGEPHYTIDETITAITQTSPTSFTYVNEAGVPVTVTFNIGATFPPAPCPLPGNTKVLVFSSTAFPTGALATLECVRWGVCT